MRFPPCSARLRRSPPHRLPSRAPEHQRLIGAQCIGGQVGGHVGEHGLAEFAQGTGQAGLLAAEVAQDGVFLVPEVPDVGRDLPVLGQELLPEDRQIAAYVRNLGDEEYTVLCNLSGEQAGLPCALGKFGEPVLANMPADLAANTLCPYQALVLRRS